MSETITLYAVHRSLTDQKLRLATWEVIETAKQFRGTTHSDVGYQTHIRKNRGDVPDYPWARTPAAAVTRFVAVNTQRSLAAAAQAKALARDSAEARDLL